MDDSERRRWDTHYRELIAPLSPIYSVCIAENDAWTNAIADPIIHCSRDDRLQGTCRMGSVDDPRTVVDPDCRVLSLDGLRVADASIMPDIVRANTHLSSIVIGENAARKILAGRHQRLASVSEGVREKVDHVGANATTTVTAKL